MSSLSSSRHLLMLPGVLLTERVFSSQLSRIRSVFPRLTIHTPIIGGQSSIQLMAKKLLSEAPSRFSICGLSLGGYLAMEMIRQAPHRIDRVILMSTQANADTYNHRIRRLALIDEAKAMQSTDPIVTKQIPLLLTPFHQSANNPFASSLYLQGRAVGVQSFIDQQNMCLSRVDSHDVLRSLRCPSLIICGEEDQLTPIRVHRDMANSIQSSPSASNNNNEGPIIIRNAGHLPSMENPEAVNDAVLPFLSKLFEYQNIDNNKIKTYSFANPTPNNHAALSFA